MEREREYLIILDLLCRIVEANRGIELSDHKLKEAESLAKKFFFHSASAFYLSRGTIIHDFPSVQVDFIDPASINVIARACIESFLTFHYLFSSCVSDEERDFRFYSWLLGGLKEREKFLHMLIEAKKVLQDEQSRIRSKWLNDQQCIQKYEQILRHNKIFQQLSERQQKRILGGDWRNKILDGKCNRMSWREIALDAKLTEMDAEHFYRLLCGYAHSSSLSTLQLSQANTRAQQMGLIAGPMGVIKTAMSNFIFEYCELFPNSKSELNRDAEAKRVAENWVWIGRKEVE